MGTDPAIYSGRADLGKFNGTWKSPVFELSNHPVNLTIIQPGPLSKRIFNVIYIYYAMDFHNGIS